jgi:gamma-glutamylcyclotransferase (GGCT)/AIG2-like uncharacterized protein YtfP
MSNYYFSYGSNMNASRMSKRGLNVTRSLAGALGNSALKFNKKAYEAPHRSYANVVYARNSIVEGVLYELAHTSEIIKMDPFEGTPRLYSRELFEIQTEEGVIPAWVYIANKALIDNQLKPERWYLEHLLAGESFLSAEYYEQLRQVECIEGGSSR